MGKKSGSAWLEFEILATPSEAEALQRACETYTRGWRWGFEQQTLGLADTDWIAFRALRADGYDEPLYRGVRKGFQAAWCVAHGRGERPEPRDVAQSSGSHVRHDNGEVLAFDATFATLPPLPAKFKVSSLRIEHANGGWRAWILGRDRSISVK